MSEMRLACDDEVDGSGDEEAEEAWYRWSPATACACCQSFPTENRSRLQRATRIGSSEGRPFHSLPLRPPVRILTPLTVPGIDDGGQAE